ncbi:hypothetical protein I7I51_07346 [Histoplasma capsulatum]|uniref:Uncharacterized protein n=1 Tax=Ajellomyces capsulatus TaxID=5037 RepID=A0A8A1MKV8_AJECA|nr:hypothetical protein I7I51_07346 [Histoplasma capsulatum]
MPLADSNRLTLVPSAADVRQIGDICRATDRNAEPRLQQRLSKERPPRIPLRINTNAPPSRLTKTTSFLSHEHPWKRYIGVWEKNRAGTAILAYENVMSFPVVFIKKRSSRSSQEPVQHLKPVSHANITHLKEAFMSGESIYFVYEAMRTSLSQLHCSPPHPLQ